MNKKIIPSTPFGSSGILWAVKDDGPRIVRIFLSRPGTPAEERIAALSPAARLVSCAEIDDIAIAIRRFLAGEAIRFSLDSVDLKRCPAFQQRVLRAEHRIPPGAISTYQQIAIYLGLRKGARAVGNALATNPFPLIVPCHRVIRSDRHLGGYQGGLEMKRTLLEREGILFDISGRVAHTQPLFRF